MARAPTFSRRTSWDRAPSAFSRAVDDARSRGSLRADLTEGNPTRCGFTSADALVTLLGDPRGARYAPIALGHPSARAAIASSYAERGLSVDPERVCLTASTSEAYGFLFKLLCERGEEVLVPVPSYPLFEYLAALEDVRLVPYPLVREEHFRIDLGALDRAITDRTRAILMVHPNNPTGSFVQRDEAEALTAIAARHGLALISDEVFADYALPCDERRDRDRLPSFVETTGALTFVLSGLSKVVAQPQLKLGWIAVSGPDDLVTEALGRLEIIADTYLSVATPVQLALPEILAARKRVQAEILARVVANLAALDEALAKAGASSPVRRLRVDGGWYATLEVPRTRSDDAWVRALLDEHGVLVHPGYFFDFAGEGYLVVSLLPEAPSFRQAIGRVIATLARA